MERSAEQDERRELVFALGHEIGNLVAAIRLEAHLLDDQQGALQLARAAINIEDLSARVGALLTQLRPLLEPDAPAAMGRVDPRALLSHLRESLEEAGGRGVHCEVACAQPLPAVVADPERANALLLLVVQGALESARAATGRVGRVRVEAREQGDHVEFVIEDDGPPDAELLAWPGAARRSRALVCQVAEASLAPLGGGVGVESVEGVTRVRLRMARA